MAMGNKVSLENGGRGEALGCFSHVAAALPSSCLFPARSPLIMREMSNGMDRPRQPSHTNYTVATWRRANAGVAVGCKAWDWDWVHVLPIRGNEIA